MDRLIFLVRRDRRDLFESLQRSFADEKDVEVILDRRIANRRQEDAEHSRERRRADRRVRPAVYAEVRERGWSVARVAGDR
jgi:hypothetical protein